MTKYRFFAVCLIVLVTASCSNGSKELTRPYAKELIEQNMAQNEEFMTETSFSLAGSTLIKSSLTESSIEMMIREKISTGVSEGLWQWDDGIELTNKGRIYFKEVFYTDGRGLNVINLELKKPVSKQVVEITGITGGDESVNKRIREVKFTWTYVGLPEIVTKYFGEENGKLHDGAAFVQLYDEGWRIKEFEGICPRTPRCKNLSDKQDLTHANAKRILEQYKDFFKDVPPMRIGALADKDIEYGINEGMWIKSDKSKCAVDLTEKGKRYFVVSKDSLSLKLFINDQVLEIIMIQIEGITSGKLGSKEAKFTFALRPTRAYERYFDDMNRGTQKLKGTALMRVYDDGWKIDRIIDLRR